MIDRRTEAAQALEQLLARARRSALPAEDCQRLVEHVALVPGRLRQVAHALSAQRDPAAVDALLQLPPHVPGVVEGVHAAVLRGVTRRRAKAFEEALARAHQVFGPDLERLDVDGQPCFRVTVTEGRGTLAGRVAAIAQDVQWLHARLGRLRGTRLWLGGWCFPVDGPWRAPIQVHLVRAWLQWAASRTETRL